MHLSESKVSPKLGSSKTRKQTTNVKNKTVKTTGISSDELNGVREENKNVKSTLDILKISNEMLKINTTSWKIS